MILRRITESITQQNWFAVGVELVILVLGVFIGIQVSNWNDERADRQREREALRTIADDIASDRVELHSGIEFARQMIAAANYSLAAAGYQPVRTIAMPITDIPQLSSYAFSLPAPVEPPPDQRRSLWLRSVVRYYPTENGAAIEALTAGGDLSLIRNADLVRELLLYRQLWQGLEDSQASTYRPFRERAVFVGQELGLSPFTEMEPDKYFALLADNPGLESALRTLLEYTVLHNSQMQAVDNKAAEVLALMQDEGGLE